MPLFSSGLFQSAGSGLGLGDKSNEIQTADATETTILSLALPAGESIKIDAWIIARLSTGAKTAAWHIAGLFKRSSSGNVEQEGVTLQKDSFYTESMSWAVAFAVDTTNQTVDLNVTGAAGESVRWSVKANYTQISQ
jgi:hypothetical protein